MTFLHLNSEKMSYYLNYMSMFTAIKTG